ncbi:hypothetical protein [Halostagnicola kamekurae]|uniref:Uncharacterized protein n=1 Tax=Halostagnicola kamekurae TaxID=619731 RepID=A0A1I6SJ61_9EURY|nr:hypothetical protein [Halostagnicola kamekurae]SFS76986.1 hypothetical protein SAMN04488556_2717 [Halostagnicola kamekurae]
MRSIPLEWFRDEDGDWTVFADRRGEFVVLLAGLPLVVWLLASEVGGLDPGWRWPAVPLGIVVGIAYTRRYRSLVIDALPEDSSTTILLTLFGSGFGLSTLETLHLAQPVLLFVLAAGTTVALVYALRLLSPLHDGCEPARRGVDPPGTI